MARYCMFCVSHVRFSAFSMHFSHPTYPHQRPSLHVDMKEGSCVQLIDRDATHIVLVWTHLNVTYPSYFNNLCRWALRRFKWDDETSPNLRTAICWYKCIDERRSVNSRHVWWWYSRVIINSLDPSCGVTKMDLNGLYPIDIVQTVAGFLPREFWHATISCQFSTLNGCPTDH